MLGKVRKWLSSDSNRQQEDLRIFFEETTAICFKDCIKPSKYTFFSKKNLTDKEKSCVKACTLKKIQEFLEIEEELAKQFQ